VSDQLDEHQKETLQYLAPFLKDFLKHAKVCLGEKRHANAVNFFREMFTDNEREVIMESITGAKN